MDSRPDSRLREIFLEAVDTEDPHERMAYVEKACAGDTALRVRVEALLAMEARVGAPLEHSRPRSTLADLAAGDRVGRYRLLQQIGEGGCGVVFMAEQGEPLRRKVAVKVIKLGMDTKRVIARFDAERQALAMMDHPGIAQVFDAGATENGRPYFVMELVRGIKITDYCDEKHLLIRERLELFINICQAVQHAHQKGIIHRDLKPSNILVTELDGAPLPKIIDFGIAKAVEGRLTDQTLFTAFEQFIGTPAYMSPEQTALSAADVDTRSDIYSLGVLLYELLTDHTPFDTKDLLSAGLDEMRRTIQEREPPRPSTRSTQTRAVQSPDSAKQGPRIENDLDWIVMKCLAKERGRRYETANGLAMDVKRYLVHEPIIARPPSRFYEFTKTVRRHWVGFAATAAVMLVLALGAFVSSRQAARAREAERHQSYLRVEAEAANARADRELRNSLISQARLATLGTSLARRDTAVIALRSAAAIEASPDMIEQAITALAMLQVRDLGIQVPSVPGHTRVALSPGHERYVWYGGEQTSMQVRSFPDQQIVQEFGWTPRAYWDYLNLLPGGRTFVARDRDGPIQLFDVGSGTALWTIVGSRQDWSEGFDTGLVAVDPLGQWIAHIDLESTVELIDASTGTRQSKVRLSAFPTSLDFHPTRPWLAIGTYQGVGVFDYHEERIVRERKTGEMCRCVAWSADGSTLAHIGYGYRVELWNPERDAHFQWPGLGGFDARAAFSGDGRWLATCDHEGLLTLREAGSARPLYENLTGFPLAFSADSRRLLCRAGISGVRAYELSPSDCYFELEVPFYADPSLPGVALSPDERWLAVASYDSGILFWDLQSRGPPTLFPSRNVSSLCFNRAGSQLLFRNENGLAVLEWNGEPGQLGSPRSLVEQTTEGSGLRLTHTYSEPPLTISPSSNYNWAISRLDFSVLHSLPSRDQWSAALSPDGRWLVEGSSHSALMLYDLQTDKSVPDLSPQGGLVAFSPDGELLTVGFAGQVEGWDTRTWRRVWRTPTETVGRDTGHCVFRPQGDLLATLDSPWNIALLRPSDGKPLLRLAAPQPVPIARITFSDSGDVLVASTEAGRIQIWWLDRVEGGLAELGLDWTALAEMPHIATD